jgi:hypothetical protein
MEWRMIAYTAAPLSGGEAGRKAVDATRRTGPLKPWEERFEESLSPRSTWAETTTADGQTWRLVQTYVLGRDDYYLQPKSPGGWGKPVFTGLSPNREDIVQGQPFEEFMKTGWKKLLPLDPKYTADQDGDGLTDLVEARLGTDPANPDTDGDKVGDATDPCPDAAPRELGDEEKIIAACMDARYFEQWDTPAMLEVEGVKPFELYGYAGVLMWNSKGLEAAYGAGINSLRFSAYVDPRERGEGETPHWVQFNEDHTEATTEIGRVSGGLNGDGYVCQLRKYGDRWYVISMEMSWVS